MKKLLILLILLLCSLAHATITATDIDNSYSGDGNDKTFDFNFDIFATNEVVVVKVVDSTGVPTVQTETTHYTVSATNNNYRTGPGGTVTFVTAPASGETVYIYHVPPLTQTFNVNQAATFRTVSTTTTENTLDQIVGQIQYVNHKASLAITIPVNEIGLTLELPNAVDRANEVIWFDASGNVTTADSSSPLMPGSLTDGGVLLGSGTSEITAMAVLADGEMIVGDGTTDPVAESGATLRTSIGVGTGDSPQLTAVNFGHATDTTVDRVSAGDIQVEGNMVYRVDGNDVDVADGGTGVSTLTDGGVLLGSGANDITAMSVLADGEFIVGDGTTDPVAESGNTARTSLGLGTGDSPTFTAVNIGSTSTTLSEPAAGRLQVEGIEVGKGTPTDGHIITADGTTFSNQAKWIYDARDYDIDMVGDDVASLNTLITTVNAAGGGIIKLPAGTCSSATSVVMKSNVELLGDGRETSIFEYTGADDGIGFNAASNAGLRKLKVQCTHDDANGVTIENGSSYVRLSEVTINNDDDDASITQGAGIFLDGTSAACLLLVLDHVKGYEFKHGIQFATSVTTVLGYHCDFNGQTGISGGRGIYMANDADGVGTVFIGGTIEQFERSIEIATGGSGRVSLSWNGDIEDNTTNLPSLPDYWNGVITSDNGGWRLESSTNAAANIWFKSHHNSSDPRIIESYNDFKYVITNGGYNGDSGIGVWGLFMTGSLFDTSDGLPLTDNENHTAYPQGGFVGSGGHAIGASPEQYYGFIRDRKFAFSTAAPTAGAWADGSVVFDAAVAAGEPVGWICTESGTFGTATDATGDTDGSTAVITGMTDTSDFARDDWVDVSAGFPSTGPYKIISKTATTITLDTNSNSVQSNITVDNSDPTFTTFGLIGAQQLGLTGNTLMVGPNLAYTTIDAALNAAASGDTILVAEGTYSEAITFDDDNVTVKSVGGKVTTIITQVTGDTVSFNTRSGCTLEGFTIQITAATAATDNCISGANDDASIDNYIIDCDITWASSANITETHAVEITDGDYTFENCLISAINSNAGAVVNTTYAFHSSSAAGTKTFRDCRFVCSSSATGATYTHGIFTVVGDTIDLYDCTFDIDAAGTGDARGIGHFTAGSATINIYNNRVVCDNSSTGDSVAFAAGRTGGTFNSYNTVLDASGGTNQWWSETASGAIVNCYHGSILDGLVNDSGTTNIFTNSELKGTVVWDPANLADGAGETSAGITVTGAALGDFVLVAAPYDLQDTTVTGYVQASNTIEIRLQNESGGAVDLASGTWKVKVLK